MTIDREQAIRTQLNKLLEHLERKRERILLLQYVVEQTLKGNTAGLTERLVAKKVYDETILPGTEKASTVRTHATNLRDDLTEYYFTKGCNDDVIIRLPKPGYIPQFVFRSEASKQPENISSEGVSQGAKERDEPQQGHDLRRTVVSVEVPTEHVPEVFIKLSELVKRFPGPAVITAAYGRVGSRLFYLDCTDSGHQWLMLLWSRGELARDLGYRVNNVALAEEVDLDLALTKSLSLERCFSVPVDFSGLKIKKFTLNVDKLNGHDGALTLAWKLFRSNDRAYWFEPTALSRKIELPQQRGTFSYSLRAESGWGMLLALPVGLAVLYNEHTGQGELRAGNMRDGTFGGGLFMFSISIERELPPSEWIGSATMALYIDGVTVSADGALVEISARTVSLDDVESESHQLARERSLIRSLSSHDQFRPF